MANAPNNPMDEKAECQSKRLLCVAVRKIIIIACQVWQQQMMFVHKTSWCVKSLSAWKSVMIEPFLRERECKNAQRYSAEVDRTFQFQILFRMHSRTTTGPQPTTRPLRRARTTTADLRDESIKSIYTNSTSLAPLSSLTRLRWIHPFSHSFRQGKNKTGAGWWMCWTWSLPCLLLQWVIGEALNKWILNS